MRIGPVRSATCGADRPLRTVITCEPWRPSAFCRPDRRRVRRVRASRHFAPGSRSPACGGTPSARPARRGGERCAAAPRTGRSVAGCASAPSSASPARCSDGVTVAAWSSTATCSRPTSVGGAAMPNRWCAAAWAAAGAAGPRAVPALSARSCRSASSSPTSAASRASPRRCCPTTSSTCCSATSTRSRPASSATPASSPATWVTASWPSSAPTRRRSALRRRAGAD